MFCEKLRELRVSGKIAWLSEKARTAPCCGWKGTLNDYAEHVKTHHPDMFRSSGSIGGSLNTDEGFHLGGAVINGAMGLMEAGTTRPALDQQFSIGNYADPAPPDVPIQGGERTQTVRVVADMNNATAAAAPPQQLHNYNTPSAQAQAQQLQLNNSTTAAAPPLPSPLPARGELNGWGALEANLPISSAATMHQMSSAITKSETATSSSAGAVVRVHQWSDRQARGDMEVLHDWPDASLKIGDRMKVQTVDSSGEWAYAEAANRVEPMWIPRSILQHVIYTTRNTYEPELGVESMLPVTEGDNLFAFYHDPSGWTYGEKIPCDGSSSSGPMGWYPTSLLVEASSI
eukprot:g9569.t1